MLYNHPDDLEETACQRVTATPAGTLLMYREHHLRAI
jgi:hypothetical protein